MTMLRKLTMLAALALSLFTATAGFAEDPIPECNPCPWEDPKDPPPAR
jgi:hypothetical protein